MDPDLEVLMGSYAAPPGHFSAPNPSYSPKKEMEEITTPPSTLAGICLVTGKAWRAVSASAFRTRCCYCISAYLLSPVAGQLRMLTILDDQRTLHCNDYFVLGTIRTCLGVYVDPMFNVLWISSNSCRLNLMLV